MTEALTTARTQHDVFGVVLPVMLGALDADVVTALLMDDTGTRLDCAATRGHPGTALYGQGGLPDKDGLADTPGPVWDALKNRSPLFFETRSALAQAYPGWTTRTEGGAATAVLPLVLGGRPLGALVVEFGETHIFAPEERQFLGILAAQCAVSLGHARLGQDLEAQEAARAAEPEEQRGALAAFYAYQEAVGSENDVLVLARQAGKVVRANLPHVSAVYYALEGERWKAQVWSEDVPPEVVAQMTEGVPTDAPNFHEAAQSGSPRFVDGWDASSNSLPSATSYGAAAFLPLVIGGHTRGLFAVGTREAHAWTERDQALVRAVARGLTIALDRTESARHLAQQNAELEARTRALEAFAELTRDLAVHSDADTLIERAMQVVLSLLPHGMALFYQKRAHRWRATAQVGGAGTPALQAVIDQGFPVGHIPTLDLPDQTGEGLFQDVYDQTRDVAPELVSHLRAVATLPVWVNGRVLGIFNVALFEGWCWSPADRAVLETAARSLGLALEGAQTVNQLAQRTWELERSNAELEQFAYVASHDLQAPIRAVTSFAGIIERRYGTQLDERGRMYVQQIVHGGEQMKRLIDNLLAFSRLHTRRQELVPVDSAAVFDTVVGRLQTGPLPSGASVTRQKLPVVCADAPQLDQLLQNLISNGLKYRREGVPPQVRVWAERDGAWWRFAVSDNGIGIEQQYFERIFVIFQRLHGQEEYEGTGIGLAVCQKIIERHGGRLWVESRPGQGSTFFFTLPQA
ncbi:ATP-binding protein [Deinococcus aerophilus]|uniref:histidine kinase n=1 Tax=Deinococcus aerophilus TaxID=522488 RepID=A0ABQ2GXL1_9DEIO|nr:GAF domain-containing protein [Deinococcus aerophilus]GGM17076.1 hypothetical protein GCM10010841_26680 [Deinococcus aerophilus]